MEQWQIGPVPDYVYGNNNPGQQPHQPNDMHNAHPYQQDMARQADMARRNDQRMEFPYAALPPNMAPPQQHHQQPVQPPLNVSQQQQRQQQQQHQQQQQQQQPQQQQPQAPQTNVPPPQQQTPTQPPNAQNRNRKRPAPGTAPVVTPTATPVELPVVKAQSQTPNPPPPIPPAAAGTPVQSKEEAPAAPAAAPPAKKSRTNTPWTPQEEQRLKVMRDQGNSWAEIAKTFPSRTEGSVKKHWYKDMHYAEFAEDESQALLTAIKDYENSKWKTIGQKVGKPAKACEQYAKEHFPDLFTSNKRS